MIKQTAILLATVILVQSQRPPYAGSNKPYPGVLPQYLDQAAASASASPAVTPGVGNRVDIDGASSGSTLPATTSTIPSDLPVDALGDINLINKIKTWPRDKQPFWYINWQQIQQHRGDSNNRAQPVETNPNTRPSFTG